MNGQRIIGCTVQGLGWAEGVMRLRDLRSYDFCNFMRYLVFGLHFGYMDVPHFYNCNVIRILTIAAEKRL
jgi:hypothetical protein